MNDSPYSRTTATPSRSRTVWIWGGLALLAVVVISGATVFVLSRLQTADTTEARPSLSASADSTDPTRATLTWSGVAADEYTFECATMEDFADGQPRITSEETGTCTDLNPLQLYYARVKAGGGQWSDVATFVTSGTPVLVTGVQARAQGAGTVVVTWQPANSAETYQVQYSTDKAFGSGVESQLTTDTTVTLSGLASQTTYYIRVKAVVQGTPDTLAPYSVPAEARTE